MERPAPRRRRRIDATPCVAATCVHEAGHAIVQLASGPAPWIDFIEVADRPEEDRAGVVQTKAMHQPWMREAARSAPSDILADWRRLAARDVVNYLAGPVAELRFQGHGRAALRLGGGEMAGKCLDEPNPPKSDFGLVKARLEWIAPGGERRAFIEAWIAAETIVAAWWKEILELARALEERGRIEHEELMPTWSAMLAARGEAAAARAARTADWLKPPAAPRARRRPPKAVRAPGSRRGREAPRPSSDH